MRFGIPAAIGAVVAVGAAALGFCASSPPPRSAEGDIPFLREFAATPVPPLTFQDDAGRPRSLADFRGKLVLLNLWATWCAPCREEMPALDRLQAQLGDHDFEVLALSIDQNGTDQVRKFFAEVGINSLQIYIDPKARAGFTLGVAGIPTSLLIDGAGRVFGRHTGIAKWDSPEIVASLRGRLNR